MFESEAPMSSPLPSRIGRLDIIVRDDHGSPLAVPRLMLAGGSLLSALPTDNGFVFLVTSDELDALKTADE